MRRGLLIGLVGVACTVPAGAQVKSILGELRYQHQYQDILSAGMLSTTLRQSPRFSLQVNGDLASPQIASFNLRTTLAFDFGTGRSGENTLSTRQFLWDSYDLNLALLQYSPVKLSCSLRDNILKTKSESGFSEVFSTSVRRQEQRFGASTYKLSALPSTTVSYERTRTFSTIGDPFDQVVQRYSLGLSTANGSSAISVGGGISRLYERWTGLRNTYANVQFSATKDFTEENRLDVTADYDRYDDYGTLGGNASFAGVLDEGIRVFSSLFGRNSSSRISSSVFYGASQGLQVTVNDHWQYGGGLSVRAGNDSRLARGIVIREKSFDWTGNAALQNIGETVLGTLQNSASVTYLEQRMRGWRKSASGSLSSGLSNSIGTFTFAAGYGLSGGVTLNETQQSSGGNPLNLPLRGARQYSVGNVGNFSLNGTFPGRLRSQTSANYNDERYFGDVGYFRNRRTLMARQGFTLPAVFLIPFSLGAGASVTWYLSGIVGRSHGWYFSFNSGQFFARGLSASYRYSRTYDPYYFRESVEQTAELHYQWRSLLFEFRAREYRIVDRMREIWFSVARPFAL
jgi:hypothetical protein